MRKQAVCHPAFEDMVLPGFDQPVQEKKTRSKKQQAEDLRVIYTRHAASPRAKCNPCVTAMIAGEKAGVNVASYQRAAPEGLTFLCFRHTQEQRHLDTLAGLLSGSAK